MVNSVWTWLAEGLYPNYCLLCGLRSYREAPLCLPCEHEIAPNPECCYRCAIPLPPVEQAAGRRVCGACLKQPPPFQRVLAPWLYGEYLAHLIQLWKYQREYRLTALLGSLWLQRAEVSADVDLLVPVPLHWRRRWQRGFNQAELLCRYLQQNCPALQSSTIDTALARRQRATAPQWGMSARQRTRNLQGAFTVCRPCDNLRIAIVDDVLTTGATAASMATALASAGAAHIEVWCLARTPGPGS